MLSSMHDMRCPGCRHTVPAGRWCNRCGSALSDVATARSSGRAPWGTRALAGTGAAVAVVALLWGGPGPATPPATSADVDTAVVLADDARPAPAPERFSPPDVPPEDRTTVVCSDLQQRSVPTAELSTDEPGAVVALGDRPCVVMDPEGVTVP